MTAAPLDHLLGFRQVPERRGRGIVLTAFGRYFATKATAILDHVAAVLADSKHWPS